MTLLGLAILQTMPEFPPLEQLVFTGIRGHIENFIPSIALPLRLTCKS